MKGKHQLFRRLALALAVLVVLGDGAPAFAAAASTKAAKGAKDEASEKTVITDEEAKEAFYAHDYLFLGDSRFVGMHKAGVKKSNITFLAAKGARYSYYWDNRAQIAAMDRDTIVVYELGINDMSFEAQLATLRDLDTLGFYRVYFMAIMPVDEEKELQYPDKVDPKSNADIRFTNKMIKKGLPSDVVYIPQFKKLTIHTRDGLHYTDTTYKNWYRKMVKYIGKDLIEEGL